MPLTAVFDDEDATFAAALEVLAQGIASRAFPGASAAVVADGNLVALRGIGRFTYDDGSPEVVAETIFDLAPVSKVVGTTAMAMLLYCYRCRRGR